MYITKKKEKIIQKQNIQKKNLQQKRSCDVEQKQEETKTKTKTKAKTNKNNNSISMIAVNHDVPHFLEYLAIACQWYFLYHS